MPTSRHILLVEDEPTLQRILGSVLSDAGYEVEAVGTAEQALDRLNDSTGPDIGLVLSDKNLPEMNGLDLLDELRRREAEASVLRGFMLVTGYPSRESAVRVLKAGGDGYLVKPFRSLIDAVNEVQEVLGAPLAERRQAAARARKVADALRQEGGPGEEVQASLLLEERGLKLRARAHLENAGAGVVEPDADGDGAARVAVGARVEDLLAFRARHGESAALVLVDASASFGDLVQLVKAGGAALVDPVEIGAVP